jgi:quinolinate synthase
MAETAKILNPEKKVLLPDLRAGCSLADSCPADKFAAFREAHPNHMVISYINCTAEIKALTDIVCTSSNAMAIVKSLPPQQKIIFAPDKNLGNYLIQTTGRDMLLWEGSCMVHELFSFKKLVELKTEFSDAKVICHPECTADVLSLSDFTGSTTALLNFTKQDPAERFIVVTESGIIHQMQKASPQKTFIPGLPANHCACNDCPHMKLNTLEKLYQCLLHETPEITMDETLRNKAEKPIRKMIEISRMAGLA